MCCELCNPRLFEEFARSDPKARPKRLRNRSTIKDYKIGPYDMELRRALHDFREQQTIKKFGLSRLKNSGPGLIMSDAILKRIVDCAHMLKIRNKDDLQIETRWSCVEAFADDVLALIDAHRDPSIVPKASTPQIHGPASNSATLMPFKVVMCSRCHQQGHNSKFSHLFICTAISRHPAESNKRCPEYPRAPPPGKENVAPSRSLAQLSSGLSNMHASSSCVYFLYLFRTLLMLRIYSTIYPSAVTTIHLSN